MAAGDLTLSGATFCETEAEIKAAVEALTLPAATDTINITPWRSGVIVSATIRAAS